MQTVLRPGGKFVAPTGVAQLSTRYVLNCQVNSRRYISSRGEDYPLMSVDAEPKGGEGETANGTDAKFDTTRSHKASGDRCRVGSAPRRSGFLSGGFLIA
jgi:hypothetical protein